MDESLIVTISALEHHVYCPRQCGLIYVEGQWVDNRHTIRGQRRHRRADSGALSRGRGTTTLRSIPLWSERLGLTGRADAIEVVDGGLVPVEYKSGSRHGDAADVQLCAQALCLEEMFNVSIPVGGLWLGATRRRHEIVFDGKLRTRTEDIVLEIRAMLISGVLPAAPNDQRCVECQLRSRCVPEATNVGERSAELVQQILDGAT